MPEVTNPETIKMLNALAAKQNAPQQAAQPVVRGAPRPIIATPAQTPEEAARIARETQLKEEAAARAAAGEARAQAEFEGTGGKPTEAQQKTGTLLTRIKGGFADIQAVRARNPEAQEAGLGETISRSIFGEGLLTRKISGADRRIVTDAQRDVLDALLTLGTGAAYNAEQLEGQTLSYFPQFGDSPEEVQTKNQRLQRLIESAKINAGPKWAEVEAAIAPFMPKVPGAPAEGGAAPPLLQVAQGETFSTDQDIAIATELNSLWKGGATVEQLNQRSIELTGKPFPAETLQILQERGRAVNIVPASSGRREAPATGLLGEIRDIGVGLAGGAIRGSTANLAEELVNFIDPETAAKLQAALEYGQEQAPVSALIGELGGGVVSPFARAGNFARGAGPIMREAISGATYGTLYGAGEADPNAGLVERLPGAILGGVTGGGGGAIGGKIAQRLGARGGPGGGGAAAADEAIPAVPADELGVPGAIGEVPTPAAGDMEMVVDLARKATGRGPGRSAARRELAKMAKVNPAAQEAADRLGITLPPDVLSDDAQLLSLTGLARSQVGSEAEAAWQRTARDAIQRSDTVMDELGATTDLAQLSSDVSTRLSASMDDLQKQASTLRDEVSASFKPSDMMDATNTKAALANIVEELGGPEKAKAAMSAQEKKLLGMLMGKDGMQSYALIDRVRRDMGKALYEKAGPFVDADSRTLMQLERALAEDQLAFIEQVGGKELADKQRAANSLFSEMYAKRDELQNLFGKDLSASVVPLIRRAITSGAKGDIQALNKVVSNVPEDMRGKVLMSGLLAESTGRGAYGGFSFANFAKTYRGLRANGPVYKEFVKYIGQQGDQTLIDLYAISRRMVEAENKVLKTGKANQAMIGQMNAESLLGKVAASAGGRAVANVGTGAVAGPVMAGGMALAGELASRAGGATRTDKLHKLLISDEFRSTMEKLAAGGSTESAANRLAGSRAFVDFAKRLPIPQNFKSRAEWIKTAFAQAGGNMAPEAPTVSPEPIQ